MGYDIHITRRADWSDEDGEEITRQEWEAAANADPDLTMHPIPDGADPETHSSAEMLTRPGEQWPSEALHWMDGELRSKNPSDQLIAKMCDLATLLNAKVQGDDGEIYTVTRLPNGDPSVSYRHQ
ncbi:hypothetical protein [Streptacidiphilus rugosus]|uniref:hypothetical protein n=1 Tax=Streptacidiphilus rugosus TaxID=405783 RepID=UPI0005696C84|nr:hypothetical protein [Streptacidiphilus rugosus]